MAWPKNNNASHPGSEVEPRLRVVPSPAPSVGVELPAEQIEALLRDLGDLPAADEHWLGGWRAFEVEEGGARVAAVVWMDRETRLVRSCNLVEEETAADALVSELFAAMGDPLPGCEECRPRRLSVHDRALREMLSSILVPLEIEVELIEPDELEDAFIDVASTLAYGDMAYLHVPGVEAGEVGRFFERAAELWTRGLCAKPAATELFSISGRAPFPIMVSMSHDEGHCYVRMYVAHLDHMINDILEAPDSRGLHVLFLTFAQEGEMQPAFFDEAREHGWRMPAPDVVPLLSVADHADGLRPPEASDFQLAADILEALLVWDGSSPLDGRATHVLESGAEVQVAWPIHVSLPSS
jgi:hypothetical protein